MAIEIISRAEAQARGLRYFFSGMPCRHAHIAERYSSDARCTRCSISRDKNRRDENPEKFKSQGRQRYAENPDKFIKRVQKRYVENRDQERSRRKEYRSRNLDKHRIWDQQRYAENIDKVKAQVKKWQADNPEKKRSYQQSRRARRLGAGGSYTAEQITDLFKKQKGKCANCFCSIMNGWHNDHIVPLTRFGSNDISNIQLLCQRCNNRKYNKDPFEWAQQNGKLL